MAVVIPYGDAQAHGSLADSICFRRHRGRVVLQKKPHARAPGTPGQIIQRQKFKDGWVAFHSLNLWELEYVQAKATQQQTTPSNWYLSQYLTDAIPSTTKMSGIKQVTDLDLPETIGAQLDDFYFNIIARTDAGPVDWILADIEDNENLFNAGVVASPYNRALIRIGRNKTTPLEIPFDYPVLIWWNNFSDQPKENLIRLPEISLPEPSSTTPLSGIERVNAMNIISPEDPTNKGTRISIWAVYDSPPSESEMMNVYDHQNTWVQVNFPENAPHTKIVLTKELGPTVVFPDNYYIHITGNTQTLPNVEWPIFFPTFTLNVTDTLTFWIADDLSLYYDKALTMLAKGKGATTLDLFLAQDFSVYYDEAMTQLANSPYFQPD